MSDYTKYVVIAGGSFGLLGATMVAGFNEIGQSQNQG